MTATKKTLCVGRDFCSVFKACVCIYCVVYPVKKALHASAVPSGAGGLSVGSDHTVIVATHHLCECALLCKLKEIMVDM